MLVKQNRLMVSFGEKAEWICLLQGVTILVGIVRVEAVEEEGVERVSVIHLSEVVGWQAEIDDVSHDLL